MMKNKTIWIIGAGALLGLILLLRKGGSSQSTGPDYSATLGSFAMANDITKAGMELTAKQAEITGNVAMAGMQKDVTLTLAGLSALMTVDNAHQLRQAAFAEANSGVMTTIMENQSYLEQDRQKNANAINLVKTTAHIDMINNMIAAGIVKPTKDIVKKTADSLLSDTFH